PRGDDWAKAVAFWRTLPSDPGAAFDREMSFDAATIAPMVSWGTTPEDAAAITGTVPDPATIGDTERRAPGGKGLDYMGLTPGTPLGSIAIDRAFIGSCTNGRIEDLRDAAWVVRGRRATVPGIIVPGSGLVRAQAEAEGLDRIFIAAGFEWRR